MSEIYCYRIRVPRGISNLNNIWRVSTYHPSSVPVSKSPLKLRGTAAGEEAEEEEELETLLDALDKLAELVIEELSDGDSDGSADELLLLSELIDEDEESTDELLLLIEELPEEDADEESVEGIVVITTSSIYIAAAPLPKLTKLNIPPSTAMISPSLGSQS
jgi:hypothetical protein